MVQLGFYHGYFTIGNNWITLQWFLIENCVLSTTPFCQNYYGKKGYATYINNFLEVSLWDPCLHYWKRGVSDSVSKGGINDYSKVCDKLWNPLSNTSCSWSVENWISISNIRMFVYQLSQLGTRAWTVILKNRAPMQMCRSRSLTVLTLCRRLHWLKGFWTHHCIPVGEGWASCNWKQMSVL